MRCRTRSSALGIGVALLCLATAGSAVADSTFTVTKQTDSTVCVVGNCSLRGAVLASNSAAGANVINVPPGDYPLTLTGAGDDADTTGDLDVLHNTLTIVGTGGAAATTIHGSGDRILNVPSTSTTPSLTLTGLTLTGGGGVKFGAGVAIAHGTLTLSNDVITDNTTIDGGSGGGVEYETSGPVAMSVSNTTFTHNVATSAALQGGYGGAIAFIPAGGTGALTITNSTFTQNSASSTHSGQGGYGGAVEFDAGLGTATIVGSTFVQNSAASTGVGSTGGDGGAIWFVPETDTGSALSVTNSTFVGNSATGTAGHGTGGAILLENGDDTGTLTNVTIASNTATAGGAAVSNGGPLTPSNTIFWDNTVAGVPSSCLHPVATTGGHSGGFNIAPDVTCALSVFGDSAADPKVLPLANNGGPTATMALGDASGALDKVPAGNCPAVDQRAVVRPQGAACDIGAFEAIPAPVIPLLNPPPLIPPVPAPAAKAKAKLSVATVYTHHTDGSIVLSVTVNGAGALRVRDASATKARAAKAKPKALIATTSKTVTKASTFKLTLKPSSAARSALKTKSSVTVHLALTFTPKGGTSKSAVGKTKTVTLKVTHPKAKKKRH